MVDESKRQLDYAPPDKQDFWPKVTPGVWWLRFFILLVLGAIALFGVAVILALLYIVVGRALPPSYVLPQ